MLATTYCSLLWKGLTLSLTKQQHPFFLFLACSWIPEGATSCLIQKFSLLAAPENQHRLIPTPNQVNQNLWSGSSASVYVAIHHIILGLRTMTEGNAKTHIPWNPAPLYRGTEMEGRTSVGLEAGPEKLARFLILKIMQIHGLCLL